ncbi:hypothetical protein ACFS07_31395 [Undibacterium arcticum]
MLQKVRPYVTLFSTLGYIEDMTNGSLCATIAWSGDMNVARHRAIEAKNGNDIVTLIPKKLAACCSSTPWRSRPMHRIRKNAHLWMNYIMRPDVHANLTNKVFYATPNAASRKFVKKRN